MIELSPSIALLLYLGLTMGIILGLWVFQHYRSRTQTIFTQEKNLHVCEFCHHAYLAETTRDVTQCPQCKSFNKSNRFL